MEINGKSINFLSYTSAKSKEIQEAKFSKIQNDSLKTDANYLNYQYTDDSVKVFDVNSIGATLSDNAIVEICNSIVPELNSKNSEITNLSTTYKNFTPQEISNIKKVIYNLHIQGSGDDAPDTPSIPETPDDDNKDYVSFIDEFGDTDSMFEYLNKLNPAITKESGITRAQLVAVTQDDAWEDANGDFFGSLNRIFDVLDKDSNAVLSYAEIQDFIGEELGDDVYDYWYKVNDYAMEIQDEFESLSDQGKLEFALDKTRDYLEAAGLTAQIEALDRLLGMEDLYNDIKVGQIAIADLNPDRKKQDWITLGCYSPYTYQWEVEKNDKTYGVSVFKFDNDDNDKDADLGITLDISLLWGNWYELVNVLVHELTHATAYQYFPNPLDGIDWGTVEKLHDRGYLSDEEYDWYYENWDEDWTEEQSDLLYYRATCAWGEYTAYQTDADYLDSIAGDIFDTYTVTFDEDNNKIVSGRTTAVDGQDEKDRIMEHIAESYDNEAPPYEALPDYKWWSFA